MAENGGRVDAGLLGQVAKVVKIVDRRAGATELLVEFLGGKSPEKAIHYPALCPQQVTQGDLVLLNTTAIGLGLGTGGYHFVIANLSQSAVEPGGEIPTGHTMKLRYTPLQVRCLAVEEPDSPYHETLERAQSLDGMPVVAAGLHSQLAPICAAIKAHTAGKARIAYIMSDTASLPFAFSRLAEELQKKGLVDITITAGQAFGGDLEAVNVYSALLAAKAAAQADVAVLCQGPGNIGTETLFGFGAIYQGEGVNAVGALGGVALAAVRMSFADPRPRHRGVSQQFLVSLGRVALCRAIVVLPRLEEKKLLPLREQLTESGISGRHEVVIEEGETGLEELRRLDIKVSSMGRSVDEDREFFLAAAAAGAAAAKRYGLRGNSA